MTAVLASVRAEGWHGPSAETYVAAHQPYLVWLAQAGADSATVAAGHETAAVAYTSAVAAMPTLAELAANHATHAVLASTNFFGINTIPIAVNESDYARMWVQAAATMATYHATTGSAVASTPPTGTAPQIVTGSGQPAAASLSDLVRDIDGFVRQFTQFPSRLLTEFEDILNSAIRPIMEALGAEWDPAAGTINGSTYVDLTLDLSISPLNPIWVAIRILWLYQFYSLLAHGLLENPAAFLLQASTVSPVQVLLFAALHPILVAEVILSSTAPLAPLLSATSAVAAVAAVAAFLSLAPTVPALVPSLVGTAPLPSGGTSPTLVAHVGGGSPPAAPSAPASAAGAGSAPSTPAPSAPATGFLYAMAGVAGGPAGPGAGYNSGTGTGARASSSASALASVATPSAAAARKRRRQRTQRRDTGDAVMDLNAEPDWGAPAENEPSTAASDRGGGPLGLSGTVTHADAQAAGLTTLADDGFGGGPALPMLPKTWHPDALD